MPQPLFRFLRFWLPTGTTGKRRGTDSRRAALTVTSLEDRMVPAITVTLGTSGVTFTGDASNDQLTITQSADGFLLHNIPLAGNLVSNRDLDSALAGEQTRSVATLGSITVNAGAGDDTINAGAWTGAGIYMEGQGGDDTLIGGAGNDDLRGGAGNDTLIGNGGNDQLRGMAGDDSLDGGDGDDNLDTNFDATWSGGNDTLLGGAGNDQLNAWDGDDIFDGGSGSDTVWDRVLGDIVLTDTTYTSGSRVIRNHNVESWALYGTDNAETIDAGAWTGAGIYMEGQGGDDTLIGGAGNDDLRGGAGNDTLIGNGGNDQLRGMAGDDSLDGGDGDDNLDTNFDATWSGGNDTLLGGAGNDQLNGFDGNDDLDGGPGNNAVHAGTGNDILRVIALATDGTLDITPTRVSLPSQRTDYSEVETIRITLTDPNTSTTIGSGVTAQIQLAGLAPVVTASRVGDRIQGFFTDPGAGQTWTGTIDLGTGVGPQPLALNADKTFTFDLPASIGAITIRVGDNEGNVGTATIVGPLETVSATLRGGGTTPVTAVDVTFNRAVLASTLEVADFVVSGPGGNVPVAALFLVSETVVRVTFVTPVQRDGTYTLAVGPNITDPAGTLMATVGTRAVNIDVTGPQATGVQAVGPTVDVLDGIRVTFSRAMDPATFDASAISVTGPDGEVAVSLVSVSGNVAAINFARQTSLGTYTITLQPVVRDVNGLILDQSGDGNPGQPNDVFTASVTVVPLTTLALSGLPAVLDESATPISVTLTRAGDLGRSLAVNLSSSDPGELTVPGSVTFAVGQTVLTFQALPVPDNVVDDDAVVTVTASATGVPTASATVTVRNVQAAQLSLSFASSSIEEGSSLVGTVSRTGPTTVPLTVNLSSGNGNQLGVPATVTILAGETTATFDVTTVDDTAIEKNESVSISATAAGFTAATGTLTVTDETDLPTITLTLAQNSALEGGSPITATVTRDKVTDRPLVVKLRTSDATETTVPATVVIPAGQASVTFTIAPLTDSLVDGPQTVTVTANGSYTDCGCTITSGAGTATFTVQDADAAGLTLTLADADLPEGQTTTATLFRNSDLANPLTVQLSASPAGEVTLPATVTFAAGQATVTVQIQAVNDGVADGSKAVVITASAAGLANTTATLTVLDSAGPDLGFAPGDEGLTVPATALAGERMNVSYRVSNPGLATATGPWDDELWLSKDQTLSADDIRIGDPFRFTGDVPSGLFYGRTAPVTLPNVVGTYYVIARTDALNELAEPRESNNLRVSPPIQVAASVGVRLQAAKEIYGTNEKVLFTGTATRASGGPAAFAIVTLHIRNGDFKRTIAAMTDEAGKFRATFNPLPGESGSYTVGGTASGETDPAVQDAFTIVGINVTPSSTTLSIVEGESQAISFALTNTTGVPLTGITATVIGLPAGVTATVSGATALTANGTGTLTVTLSTTEVSATTLANLRVKLTSTEGATTEVSLSLTVVNKAAQLTIDPSRLTAGMVVGQQRAVEFTVTNTGTEASGELTIQLPSGAAWMTLGSPARVPSLAVGESTKVTLVLTPTADLPLTQYTGSLVVSGAAGQSASVPFNFRAVSEATGTFTVLAVDELYYFAAGSPALAGAEVIFRDVFTGEEKFRGVTVADGRMTTAPLNSGFYTLEVRATDHNTATATVFVEPGQNTFRQEFLSRQTVKYTWKVGTTEIQDRYTVVVESVFETNVPVPTVVIDNPVIDLADLDEVGEVMIQEMTLTNVGLIAAENVKFNVGTHPFYTITPLVTDIGTLAAKQSITIPVLVKRVATFSNGGGNNGGGTGDGGGTGGGGSGNNGGGTGDGGGTGGGGNGGGNNGGDGNGDGGDGNGGSPGGRPPVPCAIPMSLYWDYLCGPTRIGRRTGIGLVNVDGECTTPVTSPVWAGGGGGGGSVPSAYAAPVSVTPAEGCLSLPCELKVIGEVISCVLGFTPLAPYLTLADVVEDVIDAYNGSSSAVYDLAKTVGEQVTGMLSEDAGNLLSIYSCYQSISEAVAECAAESRPGVQVAATSAYGVLESGLSPFVSIFNRHADTARLLAEVLTMTAGDSVWLGEDIAGRPSFTSWFDLFANSITAGSDSDAQISAGERASLEALGTPGRATPADASRLVDRWNRSDDYWRQGWIGRADLPAGANPDFIDLRALHVLLGRVETAVQPYLADGFTDFAAAVDRDRNALLAAVGYAGSAGVSSQNQDVCATVRLQIEQQLVLSRQAVTAELGIENNTADPITELAASIIIYDLAGNDVTSRFQVRPPTLSNMSATDGTGNLGAQTTGTVSWIIVPTDEASPSGPTQYRVGGTLTYMQGGRRLTIPIQPIEVTVLPNPQLTLNYFHQRDVFSDDPFTDVVEASHPYSLAVLVKNDGAGDARNLTITSAQPKIVDNEKGLLVDFQIVATEVDGVGLTPSLTAEFGTIGAGEAAIGRWLLTSSLQGHFVDYDATFQHIDGLGDPRLSIIKSVDIHEMIHIVNAGENGDTRPDFLVNGDRDEAGIPDRVWFSDGTNVAVVVAANAAVNGTALTADATTGYSYLSVVLPSDPRFKVVKAIRSDGQEIAIGDNLWVTDRTFAARATRPVYENRLHIFDKDSTGSYTLVFEAVGLPTLAAQQIGQLVPLHRTAALDSVSVIFTRAIDTGSLTAADFSLTRDGVTVPVVGPLSVTQDGVSTYRVSGFATSTAEFGDYVLTLNGGGVTDPFGGAGAPGSVSTSWTMGERSPFVSIVRGITPNGTINRPVDHLEVQFSFPVNPASFTLDDLALTRDGGPNRLPTAAGVTIRQLSDTLFRVEGLSGATDGSGAYVFSVFAAGVTSPAGTAGTGSYELLWTNQSAAPFAPTGARFTPDNGVSVTDGRTNALVGTVVGTLPDVNVTVTVFDLTTNRELGTATKTGNQFSANVDLQVAGAHRIRVRATDPAGNFADAEFNLFVDATPPAVESFSGPPLQPREQPVGDVFVLFTERIDPATFTVDDLILSRNGGPNLLLPGSGVAITTTVNPLQFKVSGLGTLATEPGLYELLVDQGGVTDEFGNAGVGTASATWGVRGASTGGEDITPPVSRVTALPVNVSEQFVVSWSGTDDRAVTGYDVFASVDGGEYTKWQSNTTLTSAVYTAGPGQSVRFYSVARDAAGNVEAAPLEADATTVVHARGSISGTLFHDLNADGVRQAAEAGLSGWAVFLDANGNGTLDTGETQVTTAADGRYTFAALPAGTYTVAPVATDGWLALSAVSTTGSTEGVGLTSEVAPATAANTGWASLIELDRLQADPVLSGFTGAGETIAILDTGLTADPRFFAPDVIVYQYDFVDNDADATDRNGHGTAVAGMIAGQGNGVTGVAPDARLIVLRVLDDQGKGDFARVEQALQWLVANAAAYSVSAVNLSFADAAGYGVTAARYGIGDELAALTAQGVVVAAAAGNAHASAGSSGVAYPAADANVIPVGAVWSGDQGRATWRSGATDITTAADRIVSFSQRGATDQVFAPGAFVPTAGVTGTTTTYSGTSLAAPQVAALAALADQAARSRLGRGLTASEFQAVLARTGRTIVDGDDENDNVTNTGRVYTRIDVANAVADVLNLPQTPAETPPDATPPASLPVATPGRFGAAATGRTVVVGPAQDVTGVDFGFHLAAELDVTVFDDTDGDGVKQDGEAGRADVIVYLDTDASGTRDEGEVFAVTDSSGAARFTGLTPEAVRVGVEAPAGTRATNSFNPVRLTSGQTTTVPVGLGVPLDTTAPTITATRLQNGEGQRTRINRMSWTFSETVNVQALIDSGEITRAVRLVRTGGDALELSADQFRYDAATGTLTWSLDSFADTPVSLPDGDYQFQVYANLIEDAAGNKLAGPAVQRFDFHRLAGDVLGKRAVDTETLEKVNGALGSRAGSAAWDPNLDVDGDGLITARDRLAIARARGNRLPS